MSKTAIAIIAILVPAFVSLIIKLVSVMSSRKMQKLQLKEKELQIKALQQDLKNSQQDRFEETVKYTFYQQLRDLTAMNRLSNSVSQLFKKTKAERFLILVAINGKTDFRIVSVVYEQHDENLLNAESVEATKMYKNVGIDNIYKQYLENSEIQEFVELNTENMQNGILKNFYVNEKVTHSLIKAITRKPIDNNNDFLVYSSIATHKKNPFTVLEKARIKNHYEAIIIPNVIEVLENPLMI